MKREIFHFEIITPCFSGGAAPDERAEIRAASIRGQLRWWFRVLGGFKSLTSTPVHKQEALIFGSAAGEEGNAGALRLQVCQPVRSDSRVNAQDLNAGANTDLGYALFPLRPFDGCDGKRGVLPDGTCFSLAVTWRGDSSQWQEVVSLLIVWAHLGSMGFRSRRAMGAIQPKDTSKALSEALEAFRMSINVRRIDCNLKGTWRTTSEALLKWYRGWRQHGQMYRRWDKHSKAWILVTPAQKAQNKTAKGFRWARRDHNEGLAIQGTGPVNPDPENPEGNSGVTFRPALGLPIIQFFSSLGGPNGPIPRGKATVNWEFNDDGGRFASPVLLRPHKDALGGWHALVIFVDSLAWPPGQKVYLNGTSRSVSLDLYNAMKADHALENFL